MTFRDFLEQGTKFSMTGFGAGGRAGQSQATPEKAITQSPDDKDKSKKSGISLSPFNVKSKAQTYLKGVYPKNPVGSLSPAGLGVFNPSSKSSVKTSKF